MRREFKDDNFDSEYHDLKRRYKRRETKIRKQHEKRINNILRSGHIEDIIEYYDEDY